MVNYIAREYKKLNTLNRMHNFYWTVSVIIGVILLILHYIFEISYIVVWMILIPFLIILVFLTFINSGYYSRKCNNVFRNIKQCIVKMSEKNMENLIVILKEQNIKNKDEIKLLIDYFSKKLPIAVKSSAIQIFINGIVTFASFIIIFVNENSDTFDSVRLNFILTLIFIYILIYIIYKVFIFCITKISDEELYYEIVESLIFIYINFDDCYKDSDVSKCFLDKCKKFINQITKSIFSN